MHAGQGTVGGALCTTASTRHYLPQNSRLAKPGTQFLDLLYRKHARTWLPARVRSSCCVGCRLLGPLAVELKPASLWSQHEHRTTTRSLGERSLSRAGRGISWLEHKRNIIVAVKPQADRRAGCVAWRGATAPEMVPYFSMERGKHSLEIWSLRIGSAHARPCVSRTNFHAAAAVERVGLVVREAPLLTRPTGWLVKLAAKPTNVWAKLKGWSVGTPYYRCCCWLHVGAHPPLKKTPVCGMLGPSPVRGINEHSSRPTPRGAADHPAADGSTARWTLRPLARAAAPLSVVCFPALWGGASDAERAGSPKDPRLTYKTTHNEQHNRRFIRDTGRCAEATKLTLNFLDRIE